MIGFAGTAGRQGIRVELFDAAAVARELPHNRGILALTNGAAANVPMLAFVAGTGSAQPLTLGDYTIAADARVDARSDLLQKLGASLAVASDAELILRAYLKWGDQCVDHLLGDFSFVICKRHREMFAARDHFGVRPFFYAEIGNTLYFSNVLQVLRFHPAIPKDLNDLAIADFLIFGSNQDVATTAFGQIHRLPPAHSLRWSGGRLTIRRYWELPRDGTIRYCRTQEYFEHFHELFSRAVRDRLTLSKVGLMMSGGLDSTAVAAIALENSRAHPVGLRAFTAVYDRLIPDEERHFSGVAAKALGIGIDHFPMDDFRPFDGWDAPGRIAPEPVSEVFSAAANRQLYRAAAYSPTLLTGYGGDPVLHVSPHYALSLLKALRWARLARDTVAYYRIRHKLPNIGLRRLIRRRLRLERPDQRRFPEWLNPEFERRLQLRLRFRETTAEPGLLHPVRPEPYRQLASPLWPFMFEEFHPYRTGLALECSHPFFDLRLITFLLGIPPIPWCIDKEFLRSIEAASLPDEIRLRPKTPLRGDPMAEFIARQENDEVTGFISAPGIHRYVDVERVRNLLDHESAYDVMLGVLPKCLNYWLRDNAT